MALSLDPYQGFSHEYWYIGAFTAYKVDVAFMARKAEELGFDLWIPLSPWHGPLGPPTANTEQEMAEELERIAEAVIR